MKVKVVVDNYIRKIYKIPYNEKKIELVNDEGLEDLLIKIGLGLNYEIAVFVNDSLNWENIKLNNNDVIDIRYLLMGG